MRTLDLGSLSALPLLSAVKMTLATAVAEAKGVDSGELLLALQTLSEEDFRAGAL
ncbi:hypothetical protein [Halopseudomonas sp.]|uniref:hypothetical protein n=1 Tax=Halopseudomonas sp. TaxID=2901191 RepID=UPI0030028958